jgi:hypothetical protein
MSSLAASQLPLQPLGAGDLIDRAVRLYRRHFMTLIRISAPPVVVSATGSVLLALGTRGLTLTASTALLGLYITMIVVGIGLYLVGIFLNMVVMGGATRNLVLHLLWNEPVSARATYSAVRSRFWTLLGATLLVSICLGFCASVAFTAWYFVIIFVFFGAVAVAGLLSGWLAGLIGTIGTLALTAAALWLFFFLAGHFAYVPQVIMVEGKGISAAMSRSSMLAKGNARRLMAMALFTWFATWSALMIFIVPLGLYGWFTGVVTSLNQANWPAWYAIGYNVVGQSSSILLAPVWMLGLSLLYVDERVRHEGYDIELMAARRLGEMPKLAGGQSAPLASAVENGPVAAPEAQPQPPAPAPAPAATAWSPGSTLGLR